MSTELRPGYGIVHRCVMEYPGLSRDAKCLYALLQSYTGGNEVCWPSQETLAECLGCDRRSIIRWMKELEEKHLLLVIREKGGVSKYRPLIPKTDNGVRQGSHNPVTGESQPCDTAVTQKKNNENNNEDPSCSTPSPKVVEHQPEKFYFDFQDKCFYNLTDEVRERWEKAYPACDLRQELLWMREWILANGAKGHKQNWTKFVTNWLRRSQDKGGLHRN